jgi:hypothetical protein
MTSFRKSVRYASAVHGMCSSTSQNSISHFESISTLRAYNEMFLFLLLSLNVCYSLALSLILPTLCMYE